MLSVQEEVESIVARHRVALQDRIRTRKQELVAESTGHHLAFAALGVSPEDAAEIDVQQSISRLVYRHSGSMMEDVTRHCLERAHPGAGKTMIPNTVGHSPKKFEVDCLVNGIDAIEIKWRDATTDGDHVRKEAQRVEATRDAGYRPVRLMFFEPQRPQAIRIQENLAVHYRSFGGAYFKGDDAFDFMEKRAGIDLRDVLAAAA